MIRKFKYKKRQIEYTIRFSGRAKRVSINIRDGNIFLVVPPGFPINKAEEFIRMKADWILKHLNSAPPKKEGLIYRGKSMEPVYKNEGVTFREKTSEKKFKIDGDLEYLFNNWLYLIAQNYLPFRTAELADKYKFRFNRISIKQLRSRWGSCSSRGNLSFNYKLMQFPDEVIDYVIIHELCHLREMNHSPRFWRLVGNIIPNYKSLKTELRKGTVI